LQKRRKLTSTKLTHTTSTNRAIFCSSFSGHLVEVPHLRGKLPSFERSKLNNNQVFFFRKRNWGVKNSHPKNHGEIFVKPKPFLVHLINQYLGFLPPPPGGSSPASCGGAEAETATTQNPNFFAIKFGQLGGCILTNHGVF